MHAKLPSHLNYNGRRYNQTGGRSHAGTYLYINPAYGQSIQVRMARVVRTGAQFFLVEAETGGPHVRVDNHLFQSAYQASLGQIVIIGPIEMYPLGPRATSAWYAHVVTAPRCNGAISSVSPNGRSGRIVADDGRFIFVTRDQLRGGTYFQYGLRVSFVVGDNGHGPTAYDVHRAF